MQLIMQVKYVVYLYVEHNIKDDIDRDFIIC